MLNIHVLATLLFALCVTATTEDGDSKIPEVGHAKPTWRHLPGVDGNTHSLADLREHEVVVVAITCNHCPIAAGYYQRMNEFVNKYAGKEAQVTLVAISVSDLETDRLPRMKEIAKQRDLKFSYLHDASQKAGRELGASVTPQFFVLNNARTLVYRGAWDDNVNPVQAKTRYVEDAVKAVLAGESPKVAETKSPGCLVSYKD